MSEAEGRGGCSGPCARRNTSAVNARLFPSPHPTSVLYSLGDGEQCEPRVACSFPIRSEPERRMEMSHAH